MNNASQQQNEIIELTKKFYNKCSDDFEFFAKKSLKIRDKGGEERLLKINNAQKLMHDKLEEQRNNTGRVRALVLKGRQQGISTAVQARFVWRLIHSKGLKAYILTHLSESTKAIFNMTKRYIDGLPLYHPVLGNSNANELIFKDIDSGYKVGTAGSQGVGRGETVQLFHGSEVAYWPNADEHVSGILQAVPERDNTEIILESTANGTGNFFHHMCMEAQSKKNGFEMIFIPWTLQKEYSLYGQVDSLDDEEKELIGRYGLSNGQILWRRHKIGQLGDVRRFRQEYPMNVNDAFIGDTERSFITYVEISKANRPSNPIIPNSESPMIIGIDPARGGDDSAYAVRCGRILESCNVFPKRNDSMELVGDIARLINKYNPDIVYIDIGGLGAPIYDRLRERGFHIVRGVNFGQRADDPEKYANKRAEMYDRIKRWLNEPPCQLPNNEELIQELTMVEESSNSSGKLQLSPKKDLVKSPNLADAFALTFSDIINSTNNSRYSNNYQKTMTANINWNPFSI